MAKTEVKAVFTMPSEVLANAVASANAPLEVTSYPRQLLNDTRRFIDQGDYSVAVVVAHMAGEVATEQRLVEAFRVKGVEFLEQALMGMFNGYSLNNDKHLSLYQALTGDRPQNKPFWAKFKGSVARRNAIIHKGHQATEAEAEESFGAVGDLLEHFERR